MARSTDLRTRREVFAAFARTGSARVIMPTVAVLCAVRITMGEWGRGDAVALVGVAALTGPVEWVIHLRLLHASPAAWTSRRLGTGAGHREHHLDPGELRWLLLRASDAAVFLVVLAVLVAMWSLPMSIVVDGSVAPSLVSAFAFTAAGLGHYEWTHLLVHTAYRPRSRHYARLAHNHRRHHYRNERYWLGVTSNSGDRLMGTLPAADDAVPRSETARTLG